MDGHRLLFLRWGCGIRDRFPSRPSLESSSIGLADQRSRPADAFEKLIATSSSGAALAAADAIAATGASFLALAIVGQGHGHAALLAVIPLMVVVGEGLPTYNREDLLVRKSTLDETPALFQPVATFYALAAWLIDGVIVGGYRNRWELTVLWISLFLFFLVLRTAARSFAR